MLGPEHLMSFMKQHRVAGQFIHLNPDEAKTSESAAKSVGCPISRIAKSIVLLGSRPYVLVVSGDKKVEKMDKASLCLLLFFLTDVLKSIP
jgi:prolyl-tRNA editing enzyme YbaK/EbsC (Cys-tRNA(Pro) deacylase)